MKVQAEFFHGDRNVMKFSSQRRLLSDTHAYASNKASAEKHDRKPLEQQ